jgi:hypothetical protein
MSRPGIRRWTNASTPHGLFILTPSEMLRATSAARPVKNANLFIDLVIYNIQQASWPTLADRIIPKQLD